MVGSGTFVVLQVAAVCLLCESRQLLHTYDTTSSTSLVQNHAIMKPIQRNSGKLDFIQGSQQQASIQQKPDVKSVENMIPNATITVGNGTSIHISKEEVECGLLGTIAFVVLLCICCCLCHKSGPNDSRI